MTEQNLNFIKEALARCKAAQDEATAAWHLAEPQATQEVCPQDIESDPAAAGEAFAGKSFSAGAALSGGGGAAADPLVGLALAQHLMNFKLWHTEDQARRKDVGDDVIAGCKRSIDGFNQRRNDFMEKVDACIVGMCLAHLPPLPEGGRARYNTESIGAAVDRMSIISLKAYHMREETERSDADAAHIESCRKKLATLIEQRDDLFISILELIDEYAAGQKRPRVYYQFKMYNDPRLNPALYKNNPARG